MTSAYGTIAKPVHSLSVSIRDELVYPLKDGTYVVIKKVPNNDEYLLEKVRGMLNDEIESGTSYPQEFPMDMEEFKAYFLSYDAFMAITSNGESNKEVLGVFYIKPNYPGRCSHVCNGGFVTNKEYRNRGVGEAMGRAFIEIAPKLGYKSSIFNLVFENNQASVKLWNKLGFQQVGRVPGAARLKNNKELVDALIYHYKFNKSI